MAMYYETVPDLTNQLIVQVAQLQAAIFADDAVGTIAANDAIEQTTIALDQNIKAADVPLEDTMILHISTELLEEARQLRKDITAADSDAIVATINLIEAAANNLNRCVIKMDEMQPQPKLFTSPWRSI